MLSREDIAVTGNVLSASSRDWVHPPSTASVLLSESGLSWMGRPGENGRSSEKQLQYLSNFDPLLHFKMLQLSKFQRKNYVLNQTQYLFYILIKVFLNML